MQAQLINLRSAQGKIKSGLHHLLATAAMEVTPEAAAAT